MTSTTTGTKTGTKPKTLNQKVCEYLIEQGPNGATRDKIMQDLGIDSRHFSDVIRNLLDARCVIVRGKVLVTTGRPYKPAERAPRERRTADELAAGRYGFDEASLNRLFAGLDGLLSDDIEPTRWLQRRTASARRLEEQVPGMSFELLAGTCQPPVRSNAARVNKYSLHVLLLRCSIGPVVSANRIAHAVLLKAGYILSFAELVRSISSSERQNPIDRGMC